MRKNVSKEKDREVRGRVGRRYGIFLTIVKTVVFTLRKRLLKGFD